MAVRYSSPERIPSRANPNEVAAIGQLTLSYRLLPFSGRTVVGWPPQFEPHAIGSATLS